MYIIFGILIFWSGVKIYIIKLHTVVEHWSSNPEDAGSIPSQKAFFAINFGLGA